ncbi:MAG: SDR family oxidoreductase, partial [Saprospiraceae bacterium]|nr:SDR family oxidoreductase [Saprospiraceae bacterium]
LGVNLMGAANVTYWVAQQMIRARSGRIICVGSRGAFRGEPLQPAYGASKAGLHAFAQSMAVALAKYEIGVGVVAPGFVETDMVQHLLKSEEGARIRAQSPFNRVARPEEVANAVLYLADPGSMWSSGAIIDVNGASYLRS